MRNTIVATVFGLAWILLVSAQTASTPKPLVDTSTFHKPFDDASRNRPVWQGTDRPAAQTVAQSVPSPSGWDRTPEGVLLPSHPNAHIDRMPLLCLLKPEFLRRPFNARPFVRPVSGYRQSLFEDGSDEDSGRHPLFNPQRDEANFEFPALPETCPIMAH